MDILDTNVIVRFLVRDDEDLYSRSVKVLKNASDKNKKLLVKSVVVAEVCYVLESFYEKNRQEIATAMESFLAQKWLDVEERDVLISIWPWYLKNLHFVDSYLIASAKTAGGKVITFDEKLAKLAR